MYDDQYTHTVADRTSRETTGFPISGARRLAHFPGSEAKPENANEDGAALIGGPCCQTERKPVILVAVDLSPVSWDALQAGLSIAQPAQGELILFHAVHLNLTPYGPANVTSLANSLREEAMEQLKALWLRASPASVAAACLIETGTEAKMILQTANRCEADLIVLGSHPRGFVRRLFSRNIVQKVIEGAECPVLVVENNTKNFLNQNRTNCVAVRQMVDAIKGQCSHERDKLHNKFVFKNARGTTGPRHHGS